MTELARVIIACLSVVKRLIREGQERLEKYTHPDRYITPYMPGGTLFMRNPPLPLEVKQPIFLIYVSDSCPSHCSGLGRVPRWYS